MRYVAITACPTGIAHTYMAAEKLQQAAEALGHEMKVETQGSIGAENVLSAADVAAADAVIIAADKDVDLSRFAGKRVLKASVADGIHKAEELMTRSLQAPVQAGTASTAVDDAEGGIGQTLYRALMAGVSPMIPFVVVGGLMIAVALSLGGKPDPEGGLVVPPGTFWDKILQVGSVGFGLMIPILAGFIAMAIADRPGLAPGMITGVVSNTGSLYDSESGAGFLGAILAGFLAGYVALFVKRIKVPKVVQAIMPIIVIPLVATLVSSLLFIYVLGAPIAAVFDALTNWLAGMTGANAVILGIVLGAMIAFDMGGPVNKVAFLFGVGLIATGETQVMGMVGAAIATPPIGQGLATLMRRKLYNEEEREMGLAALFMGFFGITEGAIPFAAADPARVIPANIIGGSTAGAIAAIFGATNSVPHGGGIVALLGAVGNVLGYVLAIAIGALVTAVITIGLKSGGKRADEGEPVVREVAGTPSAPAASAPAAAAAAAPAAATATATRATLGNYITSDTVGHTLSSTDRDSAIRELVTIAASTGRVVDPAGVVSSALAREAQTSTGVGEGIAIPHAKTDAVSAPVVVYAKSPAGIDWNSLDGQPAQDVFLIAVPEAAAGDEHLTILSMLSRRLMDQNFRTELHNSDAAGAHRLLSEIS